jgi:hypothetical protein
MPEEQVNTEEIAEGTGGEQVTETEIDGVKCQQGDDGNYYVGSVAVFDNRKVPFRNVAEEYKRKSSETEQEYQGRLTQMEQDFNNRVQEMQQQSAQQQSKLSDDEAFDKYGVSASQYEAMRQDFLKEQEQHRLQERSQSMQYMAGQSVETQMIQAERSPEFKDFFNNDTLVQELYNTLGQLPAEVRMRPDIVENTIYLLKGKHFKEFEETIAEQARKKALENRQVVGEIQSVGSTVKTSSGQSYAVDDAVREFARINDKPLEEAAEIMDYARKAKQKALEDRKRGVI